MPQTSAPAPEEGPASRFSAADLLGPTLVFVGGFLLAVTIALPTVFVGTLRTIPMHTDLTTVAETAEPVSVFDRCSVDAPTARFVRSPLIWQQRVVAVRPSDEDRVTLQAGTLLQAEEGLDDCQDGTLAAVTDRITVDRDTAEPAIAGGGASGIQYDSGEPSVPVPDRRGYTYVLPFGTDSEDQEFFDVTTRQTVPLVHEGENLVEGRSAARYVAQVPDTDLHLVHGDTSAGRPTSLTRPASWFGFDGLEPDAEITAHLHHRSTWELSVDPSTGTILDKRITIEESYRPIDGAAGAQQLTTLDATVESDEQSRQDMRDFADDLSGPLTLWGRIAPVVTGVLGVAAIAAGLMWLTPTGRLRRWAGRSD